MPIDCELRFILNQESISNLIKCYTYIITLIIILIPFKNMNHLSTFDYTQVNPLQ